MKALLQQWAGRFDALSLRERVLIAAGALVVVGIIWLELIYTPQARAIDNVRNQLQTTASQIEALQQQIATLSGESGQDPRAAERRQLDKLREQLARTEARLQEKTAGLISPQQMAQVLEAVLTRKTDLKLLAVRNLPIEPLLDRPADAAGEERPGAGVYRHGMQIEFSGSYLGTLEYLKALQELEWDFYWDSLTLEVEDYPVSKVTLTVYTLSLKEGWIGV